ncbi:MAG: SLC13 family permease [Thermoguttaceae bacterium]
MQPEAIFTLGVLGVVIGLLAGTRLAPDIVLVGGVAVLYVSGILTAPEALAGLANEGMITVAVLFVLGAGVVQTGGVAWIADRLFGGASSAARAIGRMVVPTAGLSAVMNNTPLVAMLIPAVHEWAKQHRIAPSKLMIPLSYAAILGGTCTLIGTSTNLVVNGLLIEAADAQQPGQYAASLPRGLAMFEITWVGLPATILGLGFVCLSSRWLLPDRLPAVSTVEDPRQYTIEMLVAPGSPLVGKSIQQAGLRHLPGLYLAEIDREGVVLPAVGPEERLRAGDRLVFVGIVDSMVDLQKIRGLVPATDQVFKLDSPRSQRCLIEAVASQRCPVVGKTIRDGRFRSIYNAVVIAVAREGERIRGKIGDIVLRAGDTLLLEAHPSFLTQHRYSRDFFLISRLEHSAPPRFDRAALALGIVLGMVAVVTLSESFGPWELSLGDRTVRFGRVPMLMAAVVAAGAMLATRCVRLEDVRRSMDWQVLLAIAASLGIGRALEKTGAADRIAQGMIGLVGGNAWLALAAVYGVTLLTTELITNTAAAALMFPFALATAQQLGANPMPFIICVTMGASAGFATPIGYQTNLMVYGPGGYRFSDYLKIGVPLDLLVWAVTVGIAPLVWPF